MNKTKPSTVIIEELPSDEAYEKSMESADSGKVKKEAKKGTSPVEEKNATRKSYTNKNKELIFVEKESKIETNSKSSQIQTDKCEKSKITSDNEVRMKIKKKTKEESNMLLNKKSNIDKNKKLTSEKENKTKASTSNKIITNECQIENKLEMDLQVI